MFPRIKIWNYRNKENFKCEVDYLRHESYLTFKSVITPTLRVMTTVKTMMMMMMMMMMMIMMMIMMMMVVSKM